MQGIQLDKACRTTRFAVEAKCDSKLGAADVSLPPSRLDIPRWAAWGRSSSHHKTVALTKRRSIGKGEAHIAYSNDLLTLICGKVGELHTVLKDFPVEAPWCVMPFAVFEGTSISRRHHACR